MERKLTEWVCSGNTSYGMQMKEKICLTGLLLGMNHGCITANPNQTTLAANVSLMTKWLRQKSTDFYAMGFDAVVKRWDPFVAYLLTLSCINNSKVLSHLGKTQCAVARIWEKH
jgi:hypothetical protein